jgi:hypothetical protein
MEAYTHHHIRHAHHTGIVLGVVIGSSAVVLFAAITITIARPRLLLHPLSVSNELNLQPSTSQTPQVGPAASSTSTIFQHQPTEGAAARAAQTVTH